MLYSSLAPCIRIILISSSVASTITATIVLILALLSGQPLLLNFFVLSLLSGKLLCLLLSLLLLLQDALILRILDVLVRRQVLDCVVSHDAHIVDERVVHWTNDYGINLRCFSQMNLVDRAH